MRKKISSTHLRGMRAEMMRKRRERFTERRGRNRSWWQCLRPRSNTCKTLHEFHS